MKRSDATIIDFKTRQPIPKSKRKIVTAKMRRAAEMAKTVALYNTSSKGQIK